MGALKFLLSACSAAFAFFLFACVIEFFDSRRNKRKFRIFPKDRFLSIALAIVIGVGVANETANTFFSRAEIGAFYEKETYTTMYEATIYIKDHPIYVIVEIDRQVDGYYISSVMYPYGHQEFCWEEFYPEDNTNTLSLSEYRHDCTIVLNCPANESSFDRLSANVVSNYGDFFASKNSDIFHYCDGCYRYNSILPKNLIYFNSRQEAEILGFDFCKDCNEYY